jgi:hypothetical protein
MTDTNNAPERELSWDDEIENDGNEYTLLPAGDYAFTVVGLDRERHAGSEKLPPCNKAVVHLKFDGGACGTTTVKENLFLHTKTEGILCSFFTSIGQRQHGDRTKMDWSAVVGSTGRAKLGTREWKNDAGETIQMNQVKKYHAPDTCATPASSGAYTPGAF